MALSSQRVPSFLSPSTSSSTTPSTYDVFLSFRGEDTRMGFTDHLHAALDKSGFIVFKDDKKLERGNIIAEELLKAIKESQFAVVVISETFASSKWCLIELNAIMKCKRETGLKVFPVFYHLNPSDVRKQKGTFAKAFAKYREDPEINEEQMGAWRAALKEVGEIAGWHVDNSPEANIVDEITAKIWYGLRGNSSNALEGLVGIESQVEQMVSLLHLGMDDVQFIGIHGMGGIGKTTLAKALYDTIHSEFDASCFVCCSNNISSRNIDELQQQIIQEILRESNMKIWNPYYGIDVLRKKLCNKKVFIVLDDVNREQLKRLVGSHDWFGKESRIVVIGRDCQFWKPIVGEIYEVQPLEDKNALQLFCWKAFNKSKPENRFAQLSKHVINLVGHLPLVLEVIGSFLFGMEIDVWKSTLDDLEVCLEDEVLDKLKISYYGLKEFQKEMFLDIASFFNGVSKLEILPIFISLGYNPLVHFEVLKRKSLIKISREGVVWMHDLLRKMGQRIVYQLSRMEPGNRSRLWSDQDIIQVFKNNSVIILV